MKKAGLVFGLVFGLLCGSALVCRGNTVNANVQTGVNELGVYVVRITNTSNWTWSDIKVCLNSGLIGNGHYVEIPKLQPGVSREWPASAFANSKGERFSIAAMKIKTVIIRCTDPAGHLQSEGWNIR